MEAVRRDAFAPHVEPPELRASLDVLPTRARDPLGRLARAIARRRVGVALGGGAAGEDLPARIDRRRRAASCSLPGVFGRPVADDDDDVLETANDHVADVLQAMLDDLLRDHPPWPRAVR